MPRCLTLRGGRPLGASVGAVVAALLLAGSLAGCRTPPPAASAGSPRIVSAVASINAWGSIVRQLGGAHVRTTSIITNPNTDPHDYEPTPADGRAIADAAVVVENGIGYDPWAAKTIAATGSPHQQVIDVGRLVGVAGGGNPHRWYAPADVNRVAAAVTDDLKTADPSDAAYFDARSRSFQHDGLAPYHQLITQIRTRFAGTAVGASESIFAPMAQALGLRLITPPGFLRDISEGNDPSAADKTTIDSQIHDREIAVYVLNRQNETPDVAAQASAARRADIPVVTVTETLSPATASFQDWQVAQLRALSSALAEVTGK